MEDVLELNSFAAAEGAADALVILQPYFFDLDQESTLRYYLKATERAELPCYIYNFPARTGVNLGPGLFAELVKAYQNNNLEKIKLLNNKLSILMEIYDLGNPFIKAIKTAVSVSRKEINTSLKFPLGNSTDQERKAVKNVIKRAAVEEVVDPIGAGDAFAAGLIAGFLKGMDLRKAVELANLVGAYCVRVKGDIEGLPSWQEVEIIQGEKSEMQR